MKHFAPRLSGSTVISGSLVIDTHTLPAENNTYDLGSSTEGWRNVYATASQAISASYVATASFALNAGTGGDVDTGSLLTTASAAANIITFTKGDGSTFEVEVAQSGSIESASYASFAEDANSASFATRALTASYALNAESSTVDTGSFYLSSSIAGQVLTFTQGDGSTESVTLPTSSGGFSTDGTGILSSSAQIATQISGAFNGVTSSFLTAADTASFLTSDETGSFVSASLIANVTESSAPYLKMWVGTSASYVAIGTKDDNTLYFLT